MISFEENIFYFRFVPHTISFEENIFYQEFFYIQNPNSISLIKGEAALSAAPYFLMMAPIKHDDVSMRNQKIKY